MTQYPNTLLFSMANGRHILLKAQDETDLNEWISRINYASAFKTAGVRMRSMGMSGTEVELTGKAAAASHLKDLHGARKRLSPIVRKWDGRSSAEVLGDPGPVASTSNLDDQPLSPGKATSSKLHIGVDFETPVPPQIESGSQFKATFDQVKAELANGRWTGLDNPELRHDGRVRSHSLESSIRSPVSPGGVSENSGFPSRSQIVRGKIRDLESKISATESQLEADMRFVRNIAVLVPFQRYTRERLEAAVQGMAQRVTQVRLDMARLVCHRDVLANDLAMEAQEWRRTKQIALLVAMETLKSELGQSVPTMTISSAEEPETGRASSSLLHGSAEELSLRRRASSLTGSFYSAVEEAMERSAGSSTENPIWRASQELLDTSRVTELSLTPGTEEGHSAGYPFPPVDGDVGSPERTHGGGHQKFYTALEAPEEQAEDWNKTRAAKRVSLVKLPSDLRISTFFGRQKRAPDGVPEHGGSPVSPLADASGAPFAMFDI